MCRRITIARRQRHSLLHPIRPWFLNQITDPYIALSDLSNVRYQIKAFGVRSARLVPPATFSRQARLFGGLLFTDPMGIVKLDRAHFKQPDELSKRVST